MSKTLTINGVDRTSVTRLAGMTFSECANRGQVGAGEVTIDDPTGAFTNTLTAGVPAGSYSLTAAYGGDAANAASSGTLSITVSAAAA